MAAVAKDYTARVTRLFERQNVAAIREVEKSKRQEISAKQDEMRDTVGARYRDVIESADSIAEMQRCCSEIMSTVGSMNGRCSGLQDTVREANVEAASGAQHSDLGKLVAVGTQVKFVLDTPSHIFDCLAKSRTLDATIRFHSAAGVYSDLQGSARDTLALFPWLGAHWEEVHGCRRNIAESCRLQLGTAGRQSAGYAEALASLMLVERASALDAVGMLLGASKRWVEQSVAELRAAGVTIQMTELTSGVERLGEGLASALCLVQRVFVTAGEPNTHELSNWAGDASLLTKMLGTAAAAGVVGSTNESDKTVPHELVQSKCRAWIIECQELISSADDWLAPAVQVSDLHDLSRAIATGINTAVSRIADGSLEFTWAQVWDSTIGNSIDSDAAQASDIWTSVFRPPFYARSQQIVTAALDLTRFHEEHVKPWLAQLDGAATGAQQSGVASIGGYMWTCQRASMSQVDALVHGDVTAGEGTFLPGGQAAIKGRTEDVEALRVAFEHQLDQASADANVDSGDRKGVTGTALPDLRPMLQQICESAVVSWLKIIETIVTKLRDDAALLDFSSPSSAGSDGASSSLLQRYPMLRVAVSLSRLLVAVAESELLARMLAGAGQPTEHLQAAIRQQGFASMHVWVDAVVGSAAVALDGLSTATASSVHDVQRRGWQEISLGGEGGEEGDDDDVEVFQLPGSCSPLIFQFLFILTRELHRSGSHAVERPVLDTLRTHSGQALVEAFRQAVAQSKSQRGEKEGLVLQLLFDCRFAGLILSAPDGAMESAFEEFGSLQQDLIEELDPVDWATYETHLHDLVAQNVRRAAIVLGPLGQLHPPLATKSGAVATSSSGLVVPRSAGRVVTRPTQSMVDADLTRSVVPLISGDTPRFHTLPVSMPVKQQTKKLPQRPDGVTSGLHDEWLPAKKKAGFASSMTKTMSKIGSSFFS